MDQARVEFLLDDGWALVGRFHQWLSEFPATKHGRESVVELIDGLQRLWSLSDDLRFKRISRICLGLEQLLERFCSRSLAFSAEELKELLTLNVRCLQEILLGLEATREEPEISDPDSVRKLERYALQTVWQPITDMILVEEEPTSLPFELSIDPVEETEVIPLPEPQTEQQIVVQHNVDDGLLAMLEHFVAQLDETCHRLHGRMVADEAPYATTTSRLEHLAASTRELVGQIAQRSREPGSEIDRDHLVDPLPAIALHEMEPFEVANDLTHGVETTVPGANEALAPIDFPFSALEAGTAISDLDADATLPEVVRPLRILIVEESLFYRHLISMAVQSAGFEPCMAESVTNGLESLEQSTDFSAVLIGETVSAEMAQIIADRRRSHGLKVVGLAQADLEHQDREGVDDHVLRSRPQQLVTILNELFRQPADPMLLSA